MNSALLKELDWSYHLSKWSLQ